MCKILKIHRSGFYAWLHHPKSNREIEDDRLYEMIIDFWNESDQTYGSPRIFRDLREAGETCGENRVARIMRQRGLKAVRGYKKRKYKYSKPSDIADNLVEQNFDVEELNKIWVTDITQITTLEGWLYLAVIIDLCSRRVVGWSMSKSLHRDIVLQAIVSAKWRRNPENVVIIHSDQGSQYGSDDWIRFCNKNEFDRSMSRRGNCYDNAAAEAFFNSMKRERVWRKKYKSRDEARSDVFDYIEVFYNRKRRHEYLNYLSPAEFEDRLMAKQRCLQN